MKNLIPKIFVLVLITFVTAIGQITNADTTLAINESDSVFVMEKSPTGAMLRSVVIPGWGQFYNESYWKIPIVWGVSAWFIYNWIDRNDNYQFYRDQYNLSLTETSNGNSQYKTLRNFYRDKRDLFAVYLGLTYFLNIIDAYVDAHLFDFNIGMNNFSQQPELRIRMKL